MPFSDPERRRRYHKEYHKKWKREHPLTEKQKERKREYDKKWKREHPEYHKKWKREHPEYHKQWKCEHPYHKPLTEKQKERKRQLQRQSQPLYCAKNSARISRIKFLYRITHRDEAKKYKDTVYQKRLIALRVLRAIGIEPNTKRTYDKQTIALAVLRQLGIDLNEPLKE